MIRTEPRSLLVQDAALIQLAYEQGGLVSLQQLRQLQYPQRRADRSIREGTWTRVQRGIYQVISMPDHASRLQAAGFILPDQTISHEAAAEIHNFPDAPRGRITLTLAPQTTHVLDDGVVHRTGDLLPHHRQPHGRTSVTTPIRTADDLAAVREAGLPDPARE